MEEHNEDQGCIFFYKMTYPISQAHLCIICLRGEVLPGFKWSLNGTYHDYSRKCSCVCKLVSIVWVFVVMHHNWFDI